MENLFKVFSWIPGFGIPFCFYRLKFDVIQFPKLLAIWQGLFILASLYFKW